MEARKRIVATLAAVALAGTLSGCSGTGSRTTPAGPDPAALARTTPPTAIASTTPAPAPPSDAHGAGAHLTHVFGETHTWAKAIKVRVEDLDAVDQSQYAVAKKTATQWAFKVTITNVGKKNFDPSSLLPTMISGGTVASHVYDKKNGLGRPPSTTLSPGRTVSFKVGFGVADTNDMVMELTMGSEKPTWANF